MIISRAWSGITAIGPMGNSERETDDEIVGKQVPNASLDAKFSERFGYVVLHFTWYLPLNVKPVPSSRAIACGQSSPNGAASVLKALSGQYPLSKVFSSRRIDAVRIHHHIPTRAGIGELAGLPPIDPEIEVLGVVSHPNSLNAVFAFPVILMFIDPHIADPIVGIAVNDDPRACGPGQLKSLLDRFVFRNGQFPLLGGIAHSVDLHSVRALRQIADGSSASIVRFRRKNYVLVFRGAHRELRLRQGHADYLIRNRDAQTSLREALRSHGAHI